MHKKAKLNGLFLGRVVAIFLALSLVSCGGGGGAVIAPSTDPSAGPATTTATNNVIQITGVVSKGLFNFASVKCFFSSTGVVPQSMIPTIGDTVTTVPVDLDGRYNCPAPKDTKAVVAIVIPSPTSIMKDEATGVDVPVSSDTKFRAAIDITKSLVSKIDLNITPFSEAAVSLAERSGGLTSSVINKANSGIANIIGFNHLSTKVIQSSNAAALASATATEKKFTTLNSGLSELAATDGAGCGVKASLGAVINCTVGKLGDQFQLTTVGPATVVTLSEEGRQNLLAGAAAATAKVVALGTAVLDVGIRALTTTQNAVELNAIMAISAIDSTQRSSGRAEYQQKVAGNTYLIEIADDVYRYAVMSAMIYDDQWVNGVEAGQLLRSTTSAPVTYPIPEGYRQLDLRKYGINANPGAGLQWGVFYNDKEMVFTYRGTDLELSLNGVLDLVSDLSASVCAGTQYVTALFYFNQLFSNATFANEFLSGPTRREIVLTGHSLGGGITSYIVTTSIYASNVNKAVGFNSAPLCRVGQLSAISQANKQKITKVTVAGEPVSATVFNGVLHFLGDKNPIYPNPFSSLANPADSHSIFTALFALESTRALCTWPSCRRLLSANQPAVTVMQQPAPMTVNGLQATYSTAFSPFSPPISLTGSSLGRVDSITWACTLPSGGTCAGSPYVWTPLNWGGKVDIANDSSMKVFPTFIAAGDVTGTYNWTVIFSGTGVAPVTKTFQVTYQPQSATGLVIGSISSPQFTSGTTSISTTSKPVVPAITVSGQNLGTVSGIEWRWSGAASGSASWLKTDSTWASKVVLTGDGKLVLSPTVVEANPNWSGTVVWIATLKDAAGASRNITFTVTYSPPAVLTCSLPQVLQGNVCVTPPACALPKVLVNGVCTTVSTVLQPDLVPQNVTVGSSFLAAGGAITVNYNVANTGGGSAPVSTTRVQILNSAGAPFMQPEFSAPAIAAGSLVAQSHSISMAGAPAGTYTVYVIVDFPRTANQSNLGNDTSAGTTFTVQAATTLADLVPQSISVTPNPATAGGTVTVNYTVANTGGTAAPASQTKIQIKNSSGVVLTQPTFATAGIAANSSLSQSQSVSLVGATPGTYIAFVIVDNATAVTQTSTGNDLSAGTNFTVQAAATLADLVPQSISVTPNPATAGGTVTVNYTVANTGGTVHPRARRRFR